MPHPEKRPRLDHPQIRGGPLVWRFSSTDKGGPFSWAGLADASAYKAVMESLHQFETMQESAIRAQGSHPVEIENCSKVAQDRLCAIELDDLDELMSFRLGGKTRVWCRMDRNVMLVLWWDPEHQVCPSMKIHT
jgi:hypothetical protein